MSSATGFVFLFWGICLCLSVVGMPIGLLLIFLGSAMLFAADK